MINVKKEIKTKKYSFYIDVKGLLIERSSMIINKELFKNMCYVGCKNYGFKWSCPPHSPNFENIKPEYKNFFIILVKCHSNFFIDKNEYFILTRTNAVIRNRTDFLARKLESKIKGYCLINGSCKICRICQLKEGNKCKKPENLRYSLESTGLDCDSIAKIFNEKLLWYKEKKCPEYVINISGLLTNEKPEVIEKELIRVVENDL